jgi:hypothetical protein
MLPLAKLTRLAKIQNQKKFNEERGFHDLKGFGRKPVAAIFARVTKLGV